MIHENTYGSWKFSSIENVAKLIKIDIVAKVKKMPSYLKISSSLLSFSNLQSMGYKGWGFGKKIASCARLIT